MYRFYCFLTHQNVIALGYKKCEQMRGFKKKKNECGQLFSISTRGHVRINADVVLKVTLSLQKHSHMYYTEFLRKNLVKDKSKQDVIINTAKTCPDLTYKLFMSTTKVLVCACLFSRHLILILLLEYI